MCVTTWDIACFHCQQAAEKYLKAFLVFEEQIPPHTHDLLRLIADCTPFNVRFADFQIEAEKLTRYSVATRYPVDLDINFDEARAKEAIQDAEQIIAFVKSVLPGSMNLQDK